MIKYNERPVGNIERYELVSSPLAQNPTQKKLAEILGLKKSKLEALIAHKDDYVVRRTAIVKRKERNLVYPFGKLRVVHEKLKYQLNKVKQPHYVFSPRKGKSTRDNAALHAGQNQYLKLDVKQFYPSTSTEHVFRWAKYALGMRDDVAGLFVHLATIDGAVSFGSPLTPVLATLIHRSMFDAIAEECAARGLRISLWVDDITISGNFVPGELVEKIRDIIRLHGLRSHKLSYATGSRHVAVTGVMINGLVIDAPRVLHEEIRYGYNAVLKAENRQDAELAMNKLLSSLGRYRYIVGRHSKLGVSTSNRINTVRQRKYRLLDKLPDRIDVPTLQVGVTDIVDPS